MDANVGIEGAGSDGERMPLGTADTRNIDHKPLTGFIFHRRFRELYLDSVVWVPNDFRDFSRPA